MTEKKALIGFHNKALAELTCGNIKNRGYLPEKTHTPEGMIELVTNNQYDFYLMDANLGKSGDLDISPAHQVYNLIKDRVENNEAIFLTVSQPSEVVKKAEQEGLPALNTSKLPFELDNLIGKLYRS